MDFAARLNALMDERGTGVLALARRVPCDKALISRLRNGRQQPSRDMAQRIDDVLEAGGELAALAASRSPLPVLATSGGIAHDEIAALELGHQAAVTDVGIATVERLEHAADELAVAYPGTPPGDLLERVRAYLGYTGHLIGARSTLAEHRRLLVAGGWLSLLAATCLIDLHRDALAHLRTAAQFAQETGHAEMAAWCLETRAWQALTAGEYQKAAQLAQGAQRTAPHGSSAYIQATAQEGRAWARLKAPARTRNALARVEKLVSPLPLPDQPEHHYRYDPAKSQAYVATTLSWLGDPAAEDYARQVLARLESATDGPPRPRRRRRPGWICRWPWWPPGGMTKPPEPRWRPSHRGGWCPRTTGVPARSSKPSPRAESRKRANWVRRTRKSAATISSRQLNRHSN